jgi:hypothetical protein
MISVGNFSKSVPIAGYPVGYLSQPSRVRRLPENSRSSRTGWERWERPEPALAKDTFELGMIWAALAFLAL